MPYILIQITREGVSAEQKQRLIRGATDLVVQTLYKDPAATFVVIDEVETDNWGVAGVSVTEMRKRRQRVDCADPGAHPFQSLKQE
jgi:4-oxalocrotonate tautomerase